MSRFFSLRMFSVGFAAVYTLVVIKNWPLFRYYPQIGRFTFDDLSGDRANGPGMSWFGWISWSIVGGLVLSVIVSLLVPRRLIDRIPPALFYVVLPIAMLYACWISERQWFLQ